MGLFEWFIEKDNPNPTGDFKDREPPRQDDPINWAALLIGQALFWFIIYFVVSKHWNDAFGAHYIGVFSLSFFAYIVLGYKIDVEPNYKNMGWLGIFDNPFRYTDDINRMMFFVKAILYPGYLMGESFVQLWKLVSNETK
jgi:hypothetical protein